jgi:aminopeptidase N
MLLLCASAQAQQDPRIDPDTGRATAHYPPARHFDHLHVRLDIDIPDMSKRRLTAVETLTLAAIGTARRDVRLNAVGLEIRSVEVGGRPQAFEHDGETLLVHLDEDRPPNVAFDLRIEYAGHFPYATGEGLTWTLGREDAPSLTDRSPQIHTQGQPQSNSKWFVCHDWPNEQLTSELLVTVDSDYQVCSNGRLLSSDTGPDGRTTWHWLQDKPHSTYLVVLVVGQFAVVGLGDANWRRPDLPLTVYAPVGFANTMAETFGNTGRMITHFEKLFDEPFPWDKYSQLVVRNFAAGAMENTSATTFNQGMTMGGDVDAVIAHELVHQWFGDLISYKTWADLWLGEGWATFGEALWAEHDAEPGQEREAYHRAIFSNLAASRMNTTYAPTYPGLVSNVYPNPDTNFYKANNPYSKGALVLHMLRMRLGDDVFFEGTRRFIDEYKFKPVETDDFRRTLEDVSGQSLERFFRQWVDQPGMPRVDVELAWDDEAGVLEVHAEQTQRIDADNPAYALAIPLYVTFDDEQGTYVYLPMETRTIDHSFELPARPTDVSVDPNLRVAAFTRVTKPLAMWIEELEHGSTIIARARAAEHLAPLDDESARSALAGVRGVSAFVDAIVDANAASSLDSQLAGIEGDDR